MQGGNLEAEEDIRSAKGELYSKMGILVVRGRSLEVKKEVRSARGKSRSEGVYKECEGEI